MTNNKFCGIMTMVIKMEKKIVRTIVLKVSDNTKAKMVKYYEDKRRGTIPPYVVFQAKDADTVVTLYESGKAVFQGISADIDANIWIEMEKRLNKNSKIEIKRIDNNNNGKSKKPRDSRLYHTNSIGSDEVGTGDYFGPIVVTATYVTKEDIPFLEKLGVKDSKKLTDENILSIVPELIKHIPYSSMILNNPDYNKKYNPKMNLNAIKANLHNKVLLEMTEKFSNYDYVIVDQFTTPTTYYRYLSDGKVERNITFVTKAEDQCLSVACASLISRFIFLKELDKLGKTYDVVLPKGAGYNVDEMGADLVKKYGPDILNKVAKLNFRNTDKIKKLVTN